jgi:aspartate 1-decarboxylase
MLDPQLQVALRCAAAKAEQKGDRMWVVLNVAFNRYEVLEHAPTSGRFWEVRENGQVIRH